MDAADEISALKLLKLKLEADLRTATANRELADSAAVVAKHARNELSASLNQLRKLHTSLTVVLAPLELLLTQLEQSPGNANAWNEAKGLARRVKELLAGEGLVEEIDEADTDPTIQSPVPPEAVPLAPYPSSPSARIPPPARLPTLTPSRPPSKKS